MEIIIIIINKKNWTCKIVDFAVPADHRIKQKEYEKKDKYLDLARELKKLWNMQVTIIPIVIGAFGTITKGLLKGLEDLEVGGRVETIQTTALLRTVRILRRVLATWGDLLSLRLQWKKKLSKEKNNWSILYLHSLPQMKKNWKSCGSENIQSVYRDKIWHRKMYYLNNESGKR